MANPGTADIYSVGGNPYFGVESINGITNPNAPRVSFEPSGNPANPAVNGIASALGYGAAPTSITKIDLGTDFIQYTYLAPPWHDDTNKYIMPEMLAFGVNELDTEVNSTTVLTLPKLNQILQTSWQDFLAVSDKNDPESYKNAVEFRGYLEKYGERALESYEMARQKPYIMENMKKDDPNNTLKDLAEFHRMASQDVFCWCTRFGILRKINFLGNVVNTNRAVSLELADDTGAHDHYTQVNVGHAKRLYVANVFGPSDRVTTGSKLFLNLRRKKVTQRGKVEFAEYQVMPLGTLDDYARQADHSYTDPSGRHMTGHCWPVGTVIVPGTRTPNPVAAVNAANVGVRCNERDAYESHGTLPTLTVAVGFKH